MKFFPLLAATALLAAPAPAIADSREAYCVYSEVSDSVAKVGSCDFSQYSGNIYTYFEDKMHVFKAKNQGKTYTRINRPEGIFLQRDNEQLTIFWEKPAREPGGW